MKRKITELEKNLIEKGWELDHKTYTGKHSEKTFQYVYEKVYVGEYERNDGKIVVTTTSAYCILNSKREKIESVEIKQNGGYLSLLALLFLECRLKAIEKEVNDCYPVDNEAPKEEEKVECCSDENSK